MIFNTLQFIPFIIVVLLIHRITPWKYDKLFLLAISYIFYASFNPAYTPLLLFSTTMDYTFGRLIYNAEPGKKRKMLLVLCCTINLGLLGFFKYTDFIDENIARLLSVYGIQWVPRRFDFVLPLGISFYTFHSLSYTFDIYKGKLKPAKFLDFALFVSFFTQLVAGPIVRARHFLPQLNRKRISSFPVVSHGVWLVILGFFKKIVIADNVASAAGSMFASPAQFNGYGCLTGVLAFAVQIYCDFSGYSDIAIGLSLIMGIRLKRNFNLPYLARGFSDFWRRWHISLSSFIRDYLYIPLGGNRVSHIRNVFNLIFTMAICGLWHGASWMFIFWGAYHGFLLVVEKEYGLMLSFLSRRFPDGVNSIVGSLVYKVIGTIFTFAMVCIGWVFFRAKSMHDAMLILDRIASIGYNFSWSWLGTPVIVYMGIVLVAHGLIFINMHYLKIPRLHWAPYTVVAAIMTFFILTAWESKNVFIYFQF